MAKLEFPTKKHDVLEVVLASLLQPSRRFPLIITEDNISQSALCYIIRNRFIGSEMVYGSPFISDATNSVYILNTLS